MSRAIARTYLNSNFELQFFSRCFTKKVYNKLLITMSYSEYSMRTSNNRTNNDVITLKNERVLLLRRPDGFPKRDDFRTEIVDLSIPSLYFCPHSNHASSDSHGDKCDLVLETLHVSIDPAMRGWMSSAKSYLPPVKLGAVMRASCICRIVGASSGLLKDDYPIGSIVRTEIVGVQSHYLLQNCTLRKARKLLTRLDQNFPSQPSHQQPLVRKTNLSYASFLGVLGTTGLTAYFGLLTVGQPKPSDIVLVSGAAGATGSIVAQIAKHVIKCKTVIGTAGSDAKCRWLESNGIVDIAINYKISRSLPKAIAKATNRKGVDLVFDNVGSTFLEAALTNLAMGARIVLCGAISQYNASSSNSNTTITGPRNYMNLLVKRATMKGFVVLDYKKEYPKAIADLMQWIAEGKITCYKEDTRHVGIANFYPALLSLFEGTNIGKVVLTVQNSDRSSERPRSKL